MCGWALIGFIENKIRIFLIVSITYAKNHGTSCKKNVFTSHAMSQNRILLPIRNTPCCLWILRRRIHARWSCYFFAGHGLLCMCSSILPSAWLATLQLKVCNHGFSCFKKIKCLQIFFILFTSQTHRCHSIGAVSAYLGICVHAVWAFADFPPSD